MKKKIFLAPGHGMTPQGVFDSGTIYKGLPLVKGKETIVLEHTLNVQVVDYLAPMLEPYFRVEVEAHGAPGRRAHDPNYVGTVNTINRDPSIDVAIEIHHEWTRAPKGGFGIIPKRPMKYNLMDMAKLIESGYKKLETVSTDPLLIRPGGSYIDRRGLYFLRRPTVPSFIWECDLVGVYSPWNLMQKAKAITFGIASFFIRDVELHDIKLPPSPTN